MGSLRLCMTALVVGIMVFSTNGCVASCHERTDLSGTLITDASLQQVVAGETTREWLIAAFGEPTRTEHLSDGTELVHYTYSESTHGSLAVLMLFYATSEKSGRQAVVYFEVKDGVVQRYWMEE